MSRRGAFAAAVAAGALLLSGCSLPSAAGNTVGGPVSCTGTTIGTWTAEQTANARVIAEVALGLGLGEAGVAVGEVTAITESTLVNVGYGDMMGPGGSMSSSRGLFQQLTGWGPLADRMDPRKSATMFFTGGQAGQKGLMDINGWQNMPPEMAAQSVQQSEFRDGSNYKRNLPAAQELTKAIVTGCTAPGASGANVANGPDVTIPNNQFVAEAIRGKVIKAPSAAMAKGLAAGFDQLGLQYVWGGGGSGAGPNDGCVRGGGALNSCQGIIGFDCSGLTAYVLGQAGYSIPGDSGSQRSGGESVPIAQALPGDIYGFEGHVSISLGIIDGQAYHLEASTVGTPVHIVPMNRGDVDSSVHRYWGAAGTA